eukprot:TRINITY_DN5478_c0_g1_i1.p1 TRINITY_DN5478_c0_g1~~TRINITY_DN5478_c0_g1_i1.p1  ORF type:complete len:182 (-),score=26.35 TRINITY_DN5478_c0_g1_i1:57-602(-)
MESIVCTIVGDSDVGKSSLLASYAKKRGSRDAGVIPVDKMQFVETVGNKKFRLSLRDTTGAEAYTGLHKNFYPDTDVFLFAFSTSDSASLKNLREIWARDVFNECPDAAVMLVGIRSSGSPTRNRLAVDPDQAQQYARRINAFTYVECCPATGEDVEEVFQAAARAIFERKTTTVSCFPCL